MTYNELQKNFLSIQQQKASASIAEYNYIAGVLKNNGGYIGLQDIPDGSTVTGDITGVSLGTNDDILVHTRDTDGVDRTAVLQKTMSNDIERAAAFVNKNYNTLVENSCYSLFILYSMDNARKANPVVLKNMTDLEVWTLLRSLPKEQVRVYQFSGRQNKFPSFNEFISDMNDGELFRYYSVKVALKEVSI